MIADNEWVSNVFLNQIWHNKGILQFVSNSYLFLLWLLFSVFLPVKEIQAIMKCHNRGDDRNYLVDYAAWVNSLKLPLKGRRLGIVQEALAKVNPSGADSITVA